MNRSTLNEYKLTDTDQIAAVRYAHQAIDKRDPRHFCQLIHFKDDKVLGTDGKRLHVAEINMDFILDGPHEVVNLRKTVVALIPVSDSPEARILPGRAWRLIDQEKGALYIEMALPTPDDPYNLQASTYRVIREIVKCPHDADVKGYNVDLIKDALCTDVTGISVDPGNFGELYIHGKTTEAVIMPFRMGS